jgi:hypothetical protein
MTPDCDIYFFRRVEPPIKTLRSKSLKWNLETCHGSIQVSILYSFFLGNSGCRKNKLWCFYMVIYLRARLEDWDTVLRLNIALLTNIRMARDKHSSLFWHSLSNGEKFFITLTPDVSKNLPQGPML